MMKGPQISYYTLLSNGEIHYSRNLVMDKYTF